MSNPHLLGVQTPVISRVPEGDEARGNDAVAFAKFCGLTLYPWQELALRLMCTTDPKLLWVAREVLIIVARQNGKGEILIARELAGIFLFGEMSIFHTAHFLDTAIDARDRLWEVLTANEELMYWFEDPENFPDYFPDKKAYFGVPKFGNTNGKESIRFPNGAIIRFRTRTPKTGRGLSVDLLIFDECFDLMKETYAAISKLTRARENAQTIWISSPVNKEEHRHGVIFSAKRWAAIDGARRTLMLEWSPEEGDDPFAQETWAKTNPSLVTEGPGSQLADVEAEAASAKASKELLEAFMVETLGKGNWYPRDGEIEEFVRVLEQEHVEAMTVEAIKLKQLIGLSVVIDADPGRKMCSVALAGRRKDIAFGSVVYHGPMVTADVVAAVEQLREQVDPEQILVDPRNPAKVIADVLDRNGVHIEEISPRETKTAVAEFMQSQKDHTAFFLDTEGHIEEAFNHAELKTDGEGGLRWTKQHGIICQLTALTYALRAARGAENTVVAKPAPAFRSRTIRSDSPHISTVQF